MAPKRDGIEWQHVEILDEPKPGSKCKDPRCKCMYCDHEFSAGASRVTAHLLGKKGGGACTKVPASGKAALQLRAAVALEAKATKGKLASATAAGVDLSLHCSFPSRYSSV